MESFYVEYVVGVSVTATRRRIRAMLARIESCPIHSEMGVRGLTRSTESEF